MHHHCTWLGGNYARNVARLGAALLVVGWLADGESRGQSVWDAGGGDWMDPLNWVDNTLPSGGDVVISNGGIATLSDADAIQDLYLGVSGGTSGQLQMIQFGALGSRDAFIGRQGTGHVTLTGEPTTWAADDIIVGGSASGFLTLLNKAEVTSLSGVVGESMGSNGVVIVDQESTWDVGSEFEGVLTVGAGGEGDLTIDGQAVVKSGSGVLAANAMSDGAVSVQALSQWTNEGDLTIGGLGAATLLVQSGGDVSNDNAFIANAGGTSSVTVTGAGSTWTSGGRLDVGVAGTGTLDITGGGQVSSMVTIPEDVFSALGRNAGSVGTVNVFGEGSKWTGLAVDVGVLGKGTLNITSGGDVDAFIVVAVEPTLMGTPPVSEVNVMGNGSTLTGGGIIVGLGGEAKLNVTTGGKVLSEGLGGVSIGFEAGSKGVVTIDASGSEIAVGGDVIVGGFGHGELHLTNDAAVSSDYGYVGFNEGSVGLATVASGSTWTMINPMGVAGSLTIESSGKVFNGGTDPFNRSSISGYGENVAEVTVDGAGSKWESTVVGVAVGGFFGDGLLTIKNGGDVSNGIGIVGDGADSTGTVVVDGLGSTWTNSGRLAVGLVGTGEMSVINSGVVTSQSGRIGSPVTGSNGAVTVSGISSKWEMTDTLEIGFGAGTGLLTILGAGSVIAPGGTTIGSLGTLAGTGTLASDVTNSGVVAPGTSPGTLNVTGEYFQDSDGKLEIEIASTLSFDKLLVTGQAILGGDLAIELLGSYVPAPGDAFNILMASSRLGAFDSVTVTRNSIPAGSFAVGLTGTGVTLSNFSPAGGFSAADFDEDHDVDGDDFSRWKTGFGTGSLHTQGNADGDNDVDGVDFLVWQRERGAGMATPTTAPVPEPTALPLALLACAAVWQRFRRSPAGRRAVMISPDRRG